jgi:ureidoacrylate peracid hydrolase
MTANHASARRWHPSADRVDLTDTGRVGRPVTVARGPRNVRFDLDATAAVVVDMQNDFCHPRGWLASIGVDVTPTAAVVPHLEQGLVQLRSHGVPIIWLNWGNRPDRANLPPNVIHVYDGDGTGAGIGAAASELSTAVLTEGSWGAAVVDGLTVADTDIQVPKYRMSGFWDTVLDSTLRSLRIDHLLFAGVNVDQCVLATLTDAACAGYDCLLVRDLAATTSPDFCTEATLYNVNQCFGFVIDAAALTDAVRSAPPTPHHIRSMTGDTP